MRCTISAIGLFCAVTPSHIVAQTGRQFCVLVPHFKDEYWLSVGYGLEQEAARQNVGLLMFEAGGYDARARQIEQIGQCAAQGVDALLIGTVTSDHPDLIDAIGQVARDIPVYGLVNALSSDALSGRIGVDWHEMGAVIGRFLHDAHPAGSPPQTAVFISGPPGAGWTAPLENGLRAGLADSALSITEVFGADTGLRQQLALVETALQRYPDVNYVIGSAPAIEAAIGLFAASGGTRPQLISTYISHTILRGLMNASIEAAAFDDPMQQGVMAIQMAVAGGHSAATLGPDIVLLTPGTEGLEQIHISPAEYFPALH